MDMEKLLAKVHYEVTKAGGLQSVMVPPVSREIIQHLETQDPNLIRTNIPAIYGWDMAYLKLDQVLRDMPDDDLISAISTISNSEGKAMLRGYIAWRDHFEGKVDGSEGQFTLLKPAKTSWFFVIAEDPDGDTYPIFGSPIVPGHFSILVLPRYGGALVGVSLSGLFPFAFILEQHLTAFKLSRKVPIYRLEFSDPQEELRSSAAETLVTPTMVDELEKDFTAISLAGGRLHFHLPFGQQIRFSYTSKEMYRVNL